MKNKKKLFPIVLLSVFLLSACGSNSTKKTTSDSSASKKTESKIKLTSEKIFVDSLNITPNYAKLTKDRLDINLDWSFGSDKDSMTKKSFQEIGPSINLFQNEKRLLLNAEATSNWTTKIYETSSGHVTFGFDLQDKYTPVGIKITSATFSDSYYPYNFFIDISNNKLLSLKNSYYLAYKNYTFNAMNSMFAALDEIKNDKDDDFKFHLENLKVNSDLMKKNLNPEIDSSFSTLAKNLSNNLASLYLEIKNTKNNNTVSNKKIIELSAAINEDFSEITNSYFYNNEAYKQVKSRFSPVEKGSPVDYNSSDFEKRLTHDENTINKIVQFDVNEIKPSSPFGFNLLSGEHLNFVSKTEQKVAVGDTLTVRILDVNKILDSFIIMYEIL